MYHCFFLFKSWGLAIPLCTLLGFPKNCEKHMCIISFGQVQPSPTVGKKISTTNNQSRYSRKIGIHDITGINGYLYYVCIYICIHIVQKMCASEGQIALSIGRIDFPEVPLMSNSPFSLDETKTFYIFKTCSRYTK